MHGTLLHMRLTVFLILAKRGMQKRSAKQTHRRIKPEFLHRSLECEPSLQMSVTKINIFNISYIYHIYNQYQHILPVTKKFSLFFFSAELFKAVGNFFFFSFFRIGSIYFSNANRVVLHFSLRSTKRHSTSPVIVLVAQAAT